MTDIIATFSNNNNNNNYNNNNYNNYNNNNNNSKLNSVITSNVMGGLGNQLFQIFAVVAYSIRHNMSFYFNTQQKPCAGWRSTTYWNTLLLRLLSANITALPLSSLKHVHYTESSFKHSSLPLPLPINSCLQINGYFQSEKYFCAEKEQILHMMQFPLTQSAIKQKMREHLLPEITPHTVALHFRIGDYKNLPLCHPVMPVSYYAQALAKLVATEPNNADAHWQVFYFCEEQDVETVNGHIAVLAAAINNVTFVKIPPVFDDWEQVVVMSVCHHHIISNSTFSWWGAYLAAALQKQQQQQQQQQQHVYYPSVWFGSNFQSHDTSDLCPASWVKIAV